MLNPWARRLHLGCALAAAMAVGAAPAFAGSPEPTAAEVDLAADRPTPAVAPALVPAATVSENVGNELRPAEPTAAEAALEPGLEIQATGPLPRLHATAVVDRIRGRLIVFGGYYNTATQSGPRLNDVWALPLSGAPIWSEILPAGDPTAGGLPPPRLGHAAIYDPVRDRMIVFGGSASADLNDVWALDLSGEPTWSRIVPAGVPPTARLYTSAVYDPVRDRMLVFGGVSLYVRHNDVWELSLSGSPTWSLVEPPGDLPPGRYSHTSIYDAAGDRLVICGGEFGDNDVWALPLGGGAPWERLVTSGGSPLPRKQHAAIYDPNADRMVVFGGYAAGQNMNDTWSLSLAGAPAWSRSVSSTPVPPPRAGHAAACDTVAKRLVVFGGRALTDTWVLPLEGPPAWSMLPPMDPPAPAGPVPVFVDTIAIPQATLFVGQSFTLTTLVRNDGTASDDGRIVFGIPSFTNPADAAQVSSASGGDLPGFRVHVAGSVIEDAGCRPFTAAYLVAEYADEHWAEFGGETQRFDLRVTPRAPGTFYVEVRSTMRAAGAAGCDGANGLPANGEVVVDQQGWAVKRFAIDVLPLPPPGSEPVRRRLHSAIHDPVRNRMLVFGGWVGAPNAEVWALSLDASPTWSLLLTDVGPSPRYGHSAIYDPVRDQMIVFGGFDTQRCNDVWALSLAGSPIWTRIDPAPGAVPAARRYHSAIYDPVRDRMIVFGGASGIDLSDTWALDLAEPRWTQIGNYLSRWRKHHAAAYDPTRDRMLVFGGAHGSTGLYDDIWALALSGTPSWSELRPVAGAWPSPRSGHTVTCEPSRDRMWLVGGYSGAYEHDVWTYSMASGIWEQVAAWGGPIPERQLHSTIADPGANRLVVYGGTDSLGRLGDTWFLTRGGLPTWQRLGGSPPPPPPPDPMPVFVAPIGGLPATVTIGESFQITVSVRNDGFASDDGRISLGFPAFTDPGDTQWVALPVATNHPGRAIAPIGATVRSASCEPMAAPYLIAEYADSSWQAFGIETNTVTCTIQPRTVGEFHIDVRATLHRAGAAGCEVANAVPDGGQAFTDPQGWAVRRFTVTVLPTALLSAPVFVENPGVYPQRITLGQTIWLATSVRNSGAVSDDGRIVFGFPSLTAVGDSALLTVGATSDMPGFRKLPTGTLLTDSTCATVVAPHLTLEYVDNDWRETEGNGAQVTVRPREAGVFHIDVRSTMHTAGRAPCVVVNGMPTSGTGGGTDPQGWAVKRYTVIVDPPPTAARPEFTGDVQFSTRSPLIGQTVTIDIRATNRGAASDNGRIVAGFPSFTDTADVDRVTGWDSDGGQYREIPAGSLLSDSLCSPLTAGYLVVEDVDLDWLWLGEEPRTFRLNVTPREVGTFHVDVRLTMRTAGAAACAYLNAVPVFGDTLLVDPQGWVVRRFAITVSDHPPPAPAFAGVGVTPGTITLGQAVTVIAGVINTGSPSNDGRIAFSFPSLTSAADTAHVAVPGDPGFRRYATGDTIERQDCTTMLASHVAVEYRDSQWLKHERHDLQMQVTPRDTGLFAVRVRSTLRVSTTPGCVYVNEPANPGEVDQQGWPVRILWVRVNPPPPPAPVFVDNVTGIPAAISLGESFTLTAVARNDGGGSGDGRIHFGFPGLTAPGDTQWVRSAVAGDTLFVGRAVGSLLNTAACGSVGSGYVTSEAVDPDWRWREVHAVSAVVQPQAEGTFYIDVRCTMRDTGANAGPCTYVNALPLNGAAGVTDLQGWPVKRFAVQVGPPSGPPTVSWSPITTTAGGPSARAGATAVVDTRRQALVIYGGADPGYRADVWSLPLAAEGATWSQITPGGPVPLRRIMHSMVYNSRDDQIAIFAGYYDDFLNDMVIVVLGQVPWWFLNPGYGEPPTARGGHGAVYDSLRQRMLVIGGYGGGTLRNDVWEYAPPGAGTWRELAVTGTPMPPRAQHATVYDPVRDRVIVMGGDGGTFLNDVWALYLTDPPRWEQLLPVGVPPAGRREHTAIYDPYHDRIVVYGGFDGAPRGDAWSLELGGTLAWRQLISSTPSPANRLGHVAVYDAVRKRMLVFGGSIGPSQLSREVWALDLDAPTPVAIALATTEVSSDRVRLTWAGEGLENVSSILDRADGTDGNWVHLGSPLVDGGERLVYEDRTVVPGHRYGYRLVAWEAMEAIELPIVWVTIPERATLALVGASPNPAEGELHVAFSLADGEPARLELFDLRGRRLASREVGGLGAGSHRVPLAQGERLPAGVYLVRLTRGGHVLHAKACVVR